jgi:hypothetical protein
MDLHHLDNINAVSQNTAPLLSKVMSRDQNAGQNGNIQIGNKSSETVERFKYLETTQTNQKLRS